MISAGGATGKSKSACGRLGPQTGRRCYLMELDAL